MGTLLGLLKNPIVIGFMVLAGLFFLWRIVKILNPPDPIDRTVGPYTVISVDSGASLTYATGRRDRRRESITLPGIAAPGKGQAGFDDSRIALASRIDLALLLPDEKPGTGNEAKITIDESKSKRLDRWDVVAVYSQTGQNLAIGQLLSGWAWCRLDAPKEYQAAELKARKAKKGLWALQEYTRVRITAMTK